MITSEWSDYSKKSLRHPKNAEFVTGRVNIINERKVIRISIGLLVCELLNFRKKDRVCVSVHKHDKHRLLIAKSSDPQTYTLSASDKDKNHNFLSCTFRYDFHEPFRLSQTMILDFDVNDDGLLVVDIKKLKWRN